MSAQISLTIATVDDARFVWECRQELQDSVALASGAQQTLGAHTGWMTKAVGDPERLFLIVRLDDHPRGYVRFDPDPQGGWRVSLCLTAATRGQGTGRRALGLAVEMAIRAGFTPLWADIHDDNTTSARVFTSVGFAPTARNSAGNGYSRYTLIALTAGDDKVGNDKHDER